MIIFEIFKEIIKKTNKNFISLINTKAIVIIKIVFITLITQIVDNLPAKDSYVSTVLPCIAL